MIHDMEKLNFPEKSFHSYFVWLFTKHLCGRVRKRLRFPCHTTAYALCDHGVLHVILHHMLFVTMVCCTSLVFLGTSVLCHGVRHRR